MAAPQAVAQFRNPNRKRAAVAVATYGAVLTAVVGIVTAPAAAIVVAVLSAVLVWRSLRAGLFVTAEAIVGRNLGLGWRVPLGDVAEISLMSTASDASRRTHVWVISDDGTCHQATSLHGNPLRGEALLTEIRTAVAEARSHA